MNRKIWVAITAVMLGITTTGCSQVHFGKEAVTIGKAERTKKKASVKKSIKKTKTQSSTKKIESKKNTKKGKKKDNKIATTVWDANKTAKLKVAVNKWGQKSGQVYQFYDGKKNLKTKKGASYPIALANNRFLLKKKIIKIGYTPTGKAKYDYNVVAIANDNFKRWHNTYLFCLKNKKPIILLDQSKNGNPIVVKVEENPGLNKAFKQLVK